MKIEFDPVKNRSNIERHGLDMASAKIVLSGSTLTVIDERKDYGETRLVTIGHLDGQDGRDGLDPARHDPSHHIVEEGQ